MSKKLFGTDGIRGAANKFPMTAEIAMKFGMAAGYVYKNDQQRRRVIIAKDTRISGYMIEPALVAGFISVGMDVILVGPMPTPAVPMLIKSLRADLGVMISASHNPYHDNGLKLFDANGQKLSDEQESILEDLILNQDLNQFCVEPKLLGRAKRLDDAKGRYVEHVKRSVDKTISLEGLRVVIDCANGAAYKIAPTILWELGAEVIKIGCEPDGFNINAECGSLHPQLLAQKVIETRADIGIALDGDADRLVICDEKGRVIDGDHLLAVIAAYLQKKNRLTSEYIVVTQMSNAAIEKYLNSCDLKIERTQVGDRYVSEKMNQLKSNFGGEQSGHIILSDFCSTGDGLIAALQVLSILVESEKPISEAFRPFDLHPQVIKNVRFGENNPLDSDKVKNGIDDIQKKEDNLRILVRKSGTEKLVRIMVEGENQNKISYVAGEIENLLASNSN